MSNVKKTLQMTSLLFGMTILFCYIAWTLGYEGFIIVGDIELPAWIVHIVSITLLGLGWGLQGAFVLNMYSWKILWFAIPFGILGRIDTPYFPAILFTGPLPTLVLAIIILYKKLGRWGFIRLVGSSAIILIYQWAIIKISGLDFTVHQSIYQALRLSINTTFLNLLIFSIGGVKYYGRWLEPMVFAGFLGNDHKSSENLPKSIDGIPVTEFEKWIMRSAIAVAQPIQWMFILWVCNLDNLFLDALVMTTSFICHGMIIKRNHFKPVILCTLISTAIFYTTARFTPSFVYSQFLIISIGLLQVYALYYISYQFEMDANKKAIEELKRIEALEIKISQAWQQLDDLS